MTFANLAPTWVLLGLAGIAGTLFFLQRLRVRHQPRRVVTTLFWKEAVEEARARVFVRRFRHPLAYLFALLIAGLCWLGFAHPKWAGREDRHQVFLLDGSAAMAAPGLFEKTANRVLEQVDGLPIEGRSVLLCAGDTRTLLEPGEHRQAMASRVSGLLPEACPATVEACLWRLVNRQPEGKRLLVTVAGGAAISKETLAALPPNVTVARLPGTRPESSPRGIAALGVSPARSGQWDRVDLLVLVRGSLDTSELVIEVGGRPLNPVTERTTTPAGQRVLLQDLPARGELCTVRLTVPDAQGLLDRANIVLPKRPLIRVSAPKDLEPSVLVALQADPAVTLTEGPADVAIVTRGAPPPGIPALSFSDDAVQAHAILVTHEPELSSEAVVKDAFESLGLEEVDAMDLAEAQGRAISLGAVAGPRRGVSIWRSLVSDRYNFVQSRSFPVFLARALRWMIASDDPPPFCAPGEPWPGAAAVWKNEQGREHDSLGLPFVPPRAGTYTAPDGQRLAAALTSSGLDVAVQDTLRPAVTEPLEGWGLDLVTALALAGLLLVLVEWWLTRTGRMP